MASRFPVRMAKQLRMKIIQSCNISKLIFHDTREKVMHGGLASAIHSYCILHEQYMNRRVFHKL